MEEKNFWLGFSVFSGIGPKRFSSLLSHFKTAKNAWGAPADEIKKVIGEKIGNDFDKFRNEFSLPEYLQKLREKDIWFLILPDKDYPKLLLKIENPPFVLFGKGKFDFNLPQNEKTIAVVGTRRITQYGQDVTELFVSDLVASGFVIVSGLALGVDACAHKATILEKGKTVAVLGCGIDCCTPRENQSLYNSIVSGNGCVISEFPLQRPPTPGSFPSRNRIVAGLSLGILVTEGAEDSGSLITADLGLKFNRKVFAVPGPITSSLSKGPYKLIEKGAKLVTSPEDILKEFSISNSQFLNKSKKIRFQTKDKNELKILKLLENESFNFDEISRRTKINPSNLGGILSLMEIKNFIKNSDGKFFIGS